MLADGVHHRIQPFRVRLGEIAQHMCVHPLLAAGMADADAHPPVVACRSGRPWI